MPSKLRKALGAVKGHTSVGLAKVSTKSTTSTSDKLDVLVLKATTHEEVPIDERYVAEILYLVSSSDACATACVHALARRIDHTHNWVVALKCLQLVFRAFLVGDRRFHQEVLNSMSRGSRLLDLSGFRDDSSVSCPWDYTAFVRTLGLYLDERLHCVLLGKLLGRPSPEHNRLRYVKPRVILDRIAYWQSLLDRAIATRPTGPARHNRLVQISLGLVVQESFDIYKDTSDGVDVLMDGIFGMPDWSRAEAYHACARAAKQFEKLSAFYITCQSIGVGRKSKFPNIHMISQAVLYSLKHFVKTNVEPKKTPRMLSLAAKEVEKIGKERQGRKLEDASDEDRNEETNEKKQSTGVSTDMLLPLEDDQPNATATSSDEWEQLLLKSANDITNQMIVGDRGIPIIENDCHRPSSFNPFLDNPAKEDFTIAPTFRACNPGTDSTMARPEVDPFSSWFDVSLPTTTRTVVEQEQQLWLTNQSRIIARRNLAV